MLICLTPHFLYLPLLSVITSGQHYEGGQMLKCFLYGLLSYKKKKKAHKDNT